MFRAKLQMCELCNILHELCNSYGFRVSTFDSYIFLIVGASLTNIIHSTPKCS